MKYAIVRADGIEDVVINIHATYKDAINEIVNNDDGRVISLASDQRKVGDRLNREFAFKSARFRAVHFTRQDI